MMRTLRAAGVSVPEDVEIVGLNDEGAARLVDPQLSTNTSTPEAMGGKAVSVTAGGLVGEDPVRNRTIKLAYLLTR